MFPEYDFEGPRYRNLYLLEEGKLYDYWGRYIRHDGYSDLLNVMRDNLGCVFTGNIQGYRDFPYLEDCVKHSQSKCICTKRGRALMVRAQTSRGSRWIVDTSAWNDVVEIETLGRIFDIYEHFGVGFAPTLGSLGRLYMRYIYWLYGIHKHTGLSLACERFIRKNTPSAYVHTERLGEFETAEYADIYGAYLSQYALHPAGPSMYFHGCNVEDWATWFAKCTVYIHSELALGPFPKKNPRGWRKKYGYPTKPGKYENVYLWKFQAEDCIKVGCGVQVHEGWSWNELTTDNLPWVQHGFHLRQTAPTEDAKAKTKASLLAGIGTMGMDRTRYILIEDGGDRPSDRCLVDVNSDPIDLWIREEYDSSRALMLHWWDYTRQITSSKVYNFALPFAEQGRLLAVDHDMILVLEDSHGTNNQVIRKYSAEAISAPPGSWIWLLLHNVNVLGHRRFSSDEIVHLPGVHREPEAELAA